jgi:Domain of unknown function (DUF6531)
MKFLLKVIISYFAIGLAYAENPAGWGQAKTDPQRCLDLLAQSSSPRSLPSLPTDASRQPLTDTEAAQSLGKSSLSQTSAALASPTAPSVVVTPGGNEADFITPEIESLARSLRYDPVKIYEYVYNYIKFEGYYGSKKGAHLTLMEGGGNEHDQCALLVALLRASGLNPSYQYGPCTFTYSQLVSWFGLSANPYAHLTDAQMIALFYPSGGAPVGFPSTSTRQKLAIYDCLTDRGYFYIDAFDGIGTTAAITFYSIPHVWVELNGKALSPSYKSQTVNPGINLAAAAGYSRSQVLSDVGGTVNADGGTRWVSGLNYTALSDRLKNYTQAFTQAVKTGYDGRSANRLTDATSINRVSFASLDDATPIYPDDYDAARWLPYETWTAIPELHMSKLEIQGGVWNSGTSSWTNLQYSQTLNLPSLRGRKLSLIKHPSGAILYLDETPVGNTISMPSAQTSLDLQLKVTHRHYNLVYFSNAYTVTNLGKTNQVETKNYKIDADSAYALIYCFSNPDQVLRARQEQLENYQRAGLTESDWRVKTELLNIIGLNWLYQTYQADQIVSGIYQVDALSHHRFGRVGQEPSFTGGQQSSYIDVGLQFAANQHRGSDERESDLFSEFSSLYSSAMEHGVLEQTQGTTLSAVSTIKLAYLANQSGQRIYRATSANWPAVSGELQNYPTATAASIGTTLNADSRTRALIPRSGQIILNQYKGYGYAIHEPTSVGMLIGANFGGYSSQPSPVVAAPVIQANRSAPAQMASSAPVSYAYVPYNTPQRTFSDPVDVATGAWISDSMDLSLGGGEPDGLNFTRSYNSNSRYIKGKRQTEHLYSASP